MLLFLSVPGKKVNHPICYLFPVTRLVHSGGGGGGGALGLQHDRRFGIAVSPSEWTVISRVQRCPYLFNRTKCAKCPFPQKNP